MLPVSPHECAIPADDSAERGTLESKVKEAIPVPNPPTNKARAKKKVSKWVLWQLWFNTYRYVSIASAYPRLNLSARKLFTFVFTLNMIGICLAASGHFPYAEKYASAMAFGNLNFAILMRNELFGRFLYLFVNTCFAKVNIALVQPLFRIWFS